MWNATIANLSLMALGSSAPEILLSVIECLGSLGLPQAELGPSTIVGSAAFNLLFISAVVIPVCDEPKKIDDLGVYSVTAIFSLFAYGWLYICLIGESSYGVVTLTEAILTLVFFFVLLFLAFGADRYRARKLENEKDEEDRKKDLRTQEMQIKKTILRTEAKKMGEETVIEIAQGVKSERAARYTS